MRNKRKYRLIRAALLLIAIVCLIPVGQAYYLSLKHTREQEELKRFRMETGQRQDVEAGAYAEPASQDSEKQENLRRLYRENTDLCGWLSIAGTQIDYPVLQSRDESYYLSHNFYKEKDKYGSLFVKEKADVNTPGTNFVIYGHNMKDGFMFGSLDRYKSQEFCREHTEITFDTLTEARTYEVLAVFETELSEEAGGFRYYQFYQAEEEEEFLYFYNNIKALALYDTGVTAEFGDTFLTLSTCSDAGEDVRFVVVAKRSV